MHRSSRYRPSRHLLPRQLALAACGVGALTALAFWAHGEWQLRRALADARFLIASGQAYRAGERLDPVFDQVLVRVGASPENCRLLLDAYLPARDAARLLQVAQRCGDAGGRSAESALALAEGYERLGRLQDAIEAYRQAVKSHPKSLALQVRASEFFTDQGLAQDAAQAILGALRAAPEDEILAADGMRRLAALQRWKDAAQVASRLSAWSGHTAATRLLAARTLSRSGEPDSAAREVDRGIELLSRLAQPDRARLVAAYPEMLDEKLAH